MNKLEKYFIRMLIIQGICLIIVQSLQMNDSIRKHLSKVVYYEGVLKSEMIDAFEVIRFSFDYGQDCAKIVEDKNRCKTN
ncbi:DUF5359 family protein [Bacillus manliponensis]|nr:DUF5359 family protein [Bacillus manliponensis]